jgi:hypothetical protein
MLALVSRLPRHPLALEEAAAIAPSRDETVIGAASGVDAALISRPGDPCLVTLRPCLPFAPGGLNRSCDLRVFRDRAEVSKALLPYRRCIATIGLAASLDPWLPLLRELRTPRVCPFGHMQKPPLGWTHDGRLALPDLVDAMETEAP